MKKEARMVVIRLRGWWKSKHEGREEGRKEERKEESKTFSGEGNLNGIFPVDLP